MSEFLGLGALLMLLLQCSGWNDLWLVTPPTAPRSASGEGRRGFRFGGDEVACTAGAGVPILPGMRTAL